MEIYKIMLQYKQSSRQMSLEQDWFIPSVWSWERRSYLTWDSGWPRLLKMSLVTLEEGHWVVDSFWLWVLSPEVKYSISDHMAGRSELGWQRWEQNAHCRCWGVILRERLSQTACSPTKFRVLTKLSASKFVLSHSSSPSPTTFILSKVTVNFCCPVSKQWLLSLWEMDHLKRLLTS